MPTDHLRTHVVPKESPVFTKCFQGSLQVRQSKSPTQRIPILVSSPSRWSLCWSSQNNVKRLGAALHKIHPGCFLRGIAVFYVFMFFERENATAIECTCKRFDQCLPLTMERAEGMSLCLDTESLSLFFFSLNPWSKRKFNRLWNWALLKWTSLTNFLNSA